MAWAKNRKLLAEGFRDLEYLPRQRGGWDCTLASLAFAVRRDILRGPPDLGAWAVRHGLPASRRHLEYGANALVLWHGTSRERAGKIARHGLFHKRGLWTTTNPLISHGYCRGRSERFGVEGAVVCLVLDRRELRQGVNYEVSGDGEVCMFHHGLAADVVEYVMTHDKMRFVGGERASQPVPWTRARFTHRGGAWEPVQRTPVRYSDTANYRTRREFVGLCLDRLLTEQGSVTALEAFSCLYALISPWEALSHDDVLTALGECCPVVCPRGQWQTFRRCDQPL